MRENEIIEMLGDIRCAMYDILAGDKLPKILLVIDEKVDRYCDNCPRFEAHVEVNNITCAALTSKTITSTIVTCENRDMCRSIKEFLENEKEKGE